MLTCALAFTLAPATVSWADEPDTGIETPTTGTPENADEAPAGDDAADGDDTSGESGEGEGGEGEGGEQGAQPLADSEDLPSLALQVRIASDGTESWDADDTAGNDSGPNNGIVRVNDTVTYEVEYVVTNNDAANLTWSVTFPKGMEITEIPGYCQAAGSSLTPETAGEPTIPLTADSIDELSEQTLTCNMGNRSVATDKVFVTTKVLNLAHQGQDLPLTAATVTADGVEEPVAATLPLPSVKASARLMWDISKNGTALEENTGLIQGPQNAACPWDTSRACKMTDYSVLLSAPAGGKGAMPAVGDVTFTDDISPAALYPASAGQDRDGNGVDDIADMEADLDKYGSRITLYQNGNAVRGQMQPGPKASSGNTSNSVRDSGVTVIAPSNAVGEPVEITISNADWSLKTYPSTTRSGLALPSSGDTAYAYSVMLTLWTPVDTIRTFGVESGGRTTLDTLNTYTDLEVNGFTDIDVQTEQPTWNDHRATTPNVIPPGSFWKRFVGVPGEPGNMTPSEFSPGSGFWEGPPGGATVDTGGITVAPTQNVISELNVMVGALDYEDPVTAVVCDAWDNSKLHLREADYSAQGGQLQLLPSPGKTAVWLAGGSQGSISPNYYSRPGDTVSEIEVQYSGSVAGGSGQDSQCGDDQGPWYDDPAQVPGNVPQTLADGSTIHPGVNRVRIRVDDSVKNQFANTTLALQIGMRVAANSEPTGTIVPNWGSVKYLYGQHASMQEVIDDTSRSWSANAYNPDTHQGTHGDRLILAQAQARIDKQVRKGDSGAFSSTPPNVTGGDLVQYQLSPSLTSGALTPGILKDVWVEDCLPASQSYDSASVTPAIVSPGSTPADAERPACAAGETYIRWVLPDQEVNQVIEPIVLSVEVSPTANDGVYTNTVVVWAEDDASTLAQRSDQAQIQIANIAGIKLQKEALTPVVQVNRAGQATNELNKWAVRLTNTLPASEQSGVTAPDIIDVLPKQGVQGTEFNGTFRFVEATVTQGGAATRILYTKSANVSANPQDASNGASGATTWCDAPAGGTVVSGVNGCPASASEVTGLRIQRPGAYLSGDVIEIELSMVGVGNRGGDVYVNRAMAAAEGLDNTVGPIRRPEVAIESSIGDYVWWDLNRNGLQDQFKGADEQPATEVPVRITGTDDLGNAVDISTETGDDGKYVFDQLRSSNGGGYTVTFTKPDGSEFTTRYANTVAGSDPVDLGDTTNDSNADPATGASDPVVLGRDTHDLTIDAGLTPLGGVQINKEVTGAGAGEFAATDVLKFQVVCTFDPELDGVDPTEVLNQEISLPVNGASVITSDVLGNLPAYSSCTITETDHGSADQAATPVTVTVPWDPEAEKSGTVTGSMTNFVSAGSVQVTKTLAGDDVAVEAAKDRMFEVLVTCQIEETTDEDETVRSDVYSGVVKIKGGQTKYLVDENDTPRVLPLNARCFGDEVNTGSAQESEVDFDSWENSVPVTDGTPEDLQVLTISAVNTFENAQLTVSKKVEGAGTGGAYSFTLACTITGTGEDGAPARGDYVLPEADAKFTLRDGESRTIIVPAGVNCQVKETDVPDGATVTYTDSDGTTEGGVEDGIVTDLAGADNTVKVTNTFPPKPPLALTGGQMLGAAGLLGAGLLLVGAALFLLRERRKEDATVTPAHG
ncbi:hypothetical protein J4H91_12025 [Leucobacter ruminantium]|uniref:SD-repeat containing protein B domain-containing protein n=1 Tax=Leucobacter ruminantium TaxID=1289170 RepID=A0A939LWK0_9MICO|nr:hypothetical protein [Leucobacter ruminantium]